MYMVANFENNLHIELAISSLEESGVPRNKILAIPLEQNKSDMIFDTIYKADGVSNLDLAMILGSMSMVIGTIYGFVLVWGPIIWGLLGLIGGMGIGLLIDLIPKSKIKQRIAKGNNSVMLMVHCANEKECTMIKKTMIESMALAVGKWSINELEGGDLVK